MLNFKALDRAKVQEYPFPHIVVENIWDKETYAALTQNIPPKESFEPFHHRDCTRPDGTSPRSFYWLKRQNERDPAKELTAFWQRIPFQIRAMRRTLFQKFDIPSDYSKNWDVRLIRDEKDYKINAHPDGNEKVLSCLFQLPKNDSMAQHGTVLYQQSGGQHQKVKKIDFIKNRLFVFPKTVNSWHGVEQIREEVERHQLLLLFSK